MDISTNALSDLKWLISHFDMTDLKYNNHREDDEGVTELFAYDNIEGKYDELFKNLISDNKDNILTKSGSYELIDEHDNVYEIERPYGHITIGNTDEEVLIDLWCDIQNTDNSDTAEVETESLTCPSATAEFDDLLKNFDATDIKYTNEEVEEIDDIKYLSLTANIANDGRYDELFNSLVKEFKPNDLGGYIQSTDFGYIEISKDESQIIIEVAADTENCDLEESLISIDETSNNSKGVQNMFNSNSKKTNNTKGQHIDENLIPVTEGGIYALDIDTEAAADAFEDKLREIFKDDEISMTYDNSGIDLELIPSRGWVGGNPWFRVTVRYLTNTIEKYIVDGPLSEYADDLIVNPYSDVSITGWRENDYESGVTLDWLTTANVPDDFAELVNAEEERIGKEIVHKIFEHYDELISLLQDFVYEEELDDYDEEGYEESVIPITENTDEDDVLEEDISEIITTLETDIAKYKSNEVSLKYLAKTLKLCAEEISDIALIIDFNKNN